MPSDNDAHVTVKKESEDQLLANNYYFANGGTTHVPTLVVKDSIL